jgi:hypothetical protein
MSHLRRYGPICLVNRCHTPDCGIQCNPYGTVNLPYPAQGLKSCTFAERVIGPIPFRAWRKHITRNPQEEVPYECNSR